ncbi:MAG: prepilin-type N-terminal cleavage/methylation domain-containing protein [Deltaproteobacteria bacterium]|nr:prepilin-type N-terminal cleavage/methylation domain-containing protein [Sandaracinaceae bacterium]MCX7807059.1 prepilin-type N-terminal cleavage/methylation domain-containing protein [Deltaproteobacteria bacterium]MDW8245408.1 prepilin-type N-terminal cleavage/methylation domain-containing protein [Sandaracinaceae bacterium]
MRKQSAFRQPKKRFARGFTLLEVMVAVAILSITLVSIFSSEGGSIRMAARSRRITTATLLARCKMGEIEEEIMRTGLPAVSARGHDGCCEGNEVDGFECDWEISRVVIPEELFAQSNNNDEQNPLSKVLGGQSQKTPSHLPSGPPSPSEFLSGSLLAGGKDTLAQLAMEFVLPLLKSAIEEQIRRVTVTVKWREGERTESFDVVQFVVAEQPNEAQRNLLSNPFQVGR